MFIDKPIMSSEVKNSSVQNNLISNFYLFFFQRVHTNLGISVERGLTQQKITRQERRHRFSNVDSRHLVKGGVCVTPYALLFTQVLLFFNIF